MTEHDEIFLIYAARTHEVLPTVIRLNISRLEQEETPKQLPCLWRGILNHDLASRAVLPTPSNPACRLGGGLSLGASGGAGAETVGELAGDGLEVPHAAGTGGLSALGLLAPVVLAGLSSRVAARSAGVLLDVERAATATPAQRVRLVVALAEAGGTLGHLAGLLGLWVSTWRSG